MWDEQIRAEQEALCGILIRSVLFILTLVQSSVILGVSNHSANFHAELLTRTNCELFAHSPDSGGLAIEVTGNENWDGRIHFKPIGVAGATDLDTPKKFYNVQDLMAINGHDYM